MAFSVGVRRTSPSPRCVKKSGEDFKFSQAVNKQFAVLWEDWKRLMGRYGIEKPVRMPKDVKEKLRQEAVQYAKQLH